LNSVLKKSRKFWQLLVDRRFSYIAYAAGNRLRGLDFGVVWPEQHGISAERGNCHSNSGGPQLARVVKTIGVPPRTCALDLGSGKGGAVITLSRLGYEKVVGIEIVEELVEIARRNARRARRTKVEFVVGDAGAFTDLDAFTHFYMYNPFPDVVMAEILTNLAASLDRSPRALTLIYCNPLYHDTIVRSGIFTLERKIQAQAVNHVETTRPEFFVYAHRPSRDQDPRDPSP
jgi:SAM-dependent methyltransferase